MMATPATPPTTPPAMAPTFVPDDGGDLTEGVGSAVCVLSDADVDIEDPGVEVEGIEDVGVTVIIRYQKKGLEISLTTPVPDATTES